MSSAHAERAAAVPTPLGCAPARRGPIRTWRKVPSSSDLLSAEGRAGDDGRVCQDGRGVCVCRPRRPRVPSTAPRFPSFPCGRSRVASPRLGDKPAPGLSPTPPPGTPAPWSQGAPRGERAGRVREALAHESRLARQDLQLSQAPAKAGNGGALESLRTGGGRRGSWDLHLGTHREGRLLSPSV